MVGRRRGRSGPLRLDGGQPAVAVGDLLLGPALVLNRIGRHFDGVAGGVEALAGRAQGLLSEPGGPVRAGELQGVGRVGDQI